PAPPDHPVIARASQGPALQPAADLGLIPVAVTDACDGRDQPAMRRVLDDFRFSGDALLTDIATITPLLAAPPPAHLRGQAARGPARLGGRGAGGSRRPARPGRPPSGAARRAPHPARRPRLRTRPPPSRRRSPTPAPWPRTHPPASGCPAPPSPGRRA